MKYMSKAVLWGLVLCVGGMGQFVWAQSITGRLNWTAERPVPGDQIEIEVVVELSSRSEKLGAYEVRLAWDAEVLEFQEVLAGETAGFTSPKAQAVSGELVFLNFNALGAGGEVSLIKVRFEVVGEAEQSSPLNLSFTDLVAAETFTDLLPQLQVQSATISVFEQIPEPDVAVSVESLDFGQLVEGQSSSRLFTINNAGTGTLSIMNIVPEDPQYVVSSGTFDLAAGGSRDITVTFNPIPGGASSSTLTILSNDPETPAIRVALLAIVSQIKEGPKIAVFPTSMNFGSPTLGQSKTLTLLVSNEGGQSLRVLNMVASSGDFTLSETGFRLDPGGEKILTVSFQPSLIGNVQEVLDIPSNDPERPMLQIPLRATVSTSSGAPLLALEIATLDFGQVEIGKTSHFAVPIRNDGSAMLNISNVVSDNTQVVGSPTTLSVPPQELRSFTVSFRPLPGRERNGLLTLFTNDQLQSQVRLSWSALDVVSPYLDVVRVTPEEGAFGIETETQLEVVFSEPLFHRRGFVAIDAQLTPEPLSGPILETMEMRGDGRTVSFPVRLESNRTYRLVVYGATGWSGLALFDMVETTFSTGGEAPSVGGLAGRIALVEEAELQTGSVYLVDAQGRVVAQGSIALDGSYQLPNVPTGSYRLFTEGTLADERDIGGAYDGDGDGDADVVVVEEAEQTDIDVTPVVHGDEEVVVNDGQIQVDLSGDGGNQQQALLAGVTGGQEIVLEVYARDVEALSGCGVFVTYDTTQVYFTKAEEGENILKQQGGMALFLQHVDPATASIEFGGAILGPTEETAVSGAGLLGRFHFTTLEDFAGETELTISQVTLKTLAGKTKLDPELGARLSGEEGGEPEPEPEPTTSPITLDFDLSEGDQGKRTAGNAAPGKTYELQMNAVEVPEINGWSATIEYDPQQVGYVGGSFQASDFIPGLLALVNEKDASVGVGGAVLGSDAKNAGDGTLGTLSFEVLDGFTGSTELVLTDLSFRRTDGEEDKRTVRLVATLTEEGVSLAGDFDGNGEVDFSDFFLFADAFGGTDPLYDLDGSGSVEFGDFFIFADNFGKEERAKLLVLARAYLGLPMASWLEANYPNPFNSATTLRYHIAGSSLVHLAVFDLTGQKIKTLVSHYQEPGTYEVSWQGIDEHGADVSSGVYLARLQTGAFTEIEKMTLVK